MIITQAPYGRRRVYEPTKAFHWSWLNMWRAFAADPDDRSANGANYPAPPVFDEVPF